MAWLLIATLAQFINAVVAILDKYIVTDEKILPRPFVYAFYSCILGGVWAAIYVVGLIPLPYITLPSLDNIERPTLYVVSLSFLAAYTLFIALVSLYSALRKADASDVMPVVGAVSAMSSFGMALLFLEQGIVQSYLYGIAFLAVGTLIVSRMRLTLPLAMTTFHAGLFFALHYIAMKGIFNFTTFDNGFFWSRIILVVFALSLLLVPTYLAKIREQTSSSTRRTGWLVLLTKALAGVAAILILKATELGDVAVVQSLDGLKFVFILIIGIALGHKFPSTCGEDLDCRRREVLQKVIAVSIISIGFVILFL